MSNLVVLTGNVGQNPENKNGVVKFSLATSEKWKDKNGEKQSRTDWHSCVAFGKLGDIIMQYVKKGDKLYVNGKIQYSQLEKDGKTVYYTSINVMNMEMLGSKQGQSTDSNQQFAPNEPTDNLPF